MSEMTLDSAFYQQVRSILNSARNNLYQSANSARYRILHSMYANGDLEKTGTGRSTKYRLKS